jgi:PAS domain S-box-containing protein
LVDKIDELERANNDLSNLLSSTDIALLFLDSSLCITRFTHPATKLFRLIDRDIGRPLRDIARRFTDVDLLTDVTSVLETKIALEKEIDADEGRRYLRRVVPYRTSLDRVEGVAITFLDVTHVKQAAQHERWLATVMTDSNDAILVTDLTGKIQAWNRGATAIYGYQPSEMVGVSVDQLVPAWLHVELRDLISRMSRGDQVRPLETQRLHKDGHVLDVWLTMTALRDDEGRSVAIAMTESDITSRRALEREVLEIAANEQQRIGQDLHDNTGQELTGLGLMAQSLADVLAQRSAGEAALAAKIAAGLRTTLTHVRALAKGLVPVEIDASGLTSALADLAAQTSSLHGINCVFASPRLVPLSNFTATHLYRIAQEAVTNSIKHGPAQSIIVTLASANDIGVLEIIDDGVGIGDPERRGDGIGLQIMSYRARLIGATLHVERGVPTGTRVTCTFSAAAPTRRNQTSHEEQ